MLPNWLGRALSLAYSYRIKNGEVVLPAITNIGQSYFGCVLIIKMFLRNK